MNFMSDETHWYNPIQLPRARVSRGMLYFLKLAGRGDKKLYITRHVCDVYAHVESCMAYINSKSKYTYSSTLFISK